MQQLYVNPSFLTRLWLDAFTKKESVIKEPSRFEKAGVKGIIKELPEKPYFDDIKLGSWWLD